VRTLVTVQPAEWCEAYRQALTFEQAASLMEDLRDMSPRHAALIGAESRQGWVDALSVVLHETAQRHANDPEVWTCNAHDLGWHLHNMIEEVNGGELS